MNCRDLVEWKWGDGKAFGRVSEVFTSKVTRTINGSDITREADEEEPAYLIEQIDGDGRVLKSHSELKPATKETLYQFARENDIEGRSSMSKEQLKNAAT
jgi:hypothetical protein